MAARESTPFAKKSTKRGRKPPRPTKLVPLRAAPFLTRRETQQLKANAAAAGRTIGDHTVFLIAEDLRRPASRQRPPVTPSGGKRMLYWVRLSVTPAQAKRIEARMKAERRTFSNYVARVVVSDLSES